MSQRKDYNAAGRKIFNPTGKTYLYAVPAMYRYSAEYNRKVGHISTGSREEDEKLMNEPVNTGGSIEDILRLFAKGVKIDIQDRRDIVEIYDTIEEHLKNFVEYIQNDPNVREVPLESLRLMAEFNDTIYERVKGFRPSHAPNRATEARRSLFFGGLSREQMEAQRGSTSIQQSATTPKSAGLSLVDRMEKLIANRNGG